MPSLLAASHWIIAQAAGEPSNHHNIFYTLIVGLVVGIIAKFLTPGRDPGGCIVTMLIGIGGSFIAYYIGRALHIYAPGDTPDIIASVIGAIILLAIYHITRRNSGTPSA